MRMRKIAFVLWIALVASVLSFTPAGAAGDTKGPACANIVDGGGFWDGNTLTFEFTLAKPACRTVTYTLYATTDPDGGTVYSTSTYTVDDQGRLIFTLAVPDPDPTTECDLVYVYGTTSLHRHIADRAPDAGYAQFFDDGITGDCGSPSRSFH
jgi:hypothetical protein